MTGMKEIRILWTDDEIDLLRPHILFLEEKGYEVVTAQNGDEAVKLVEEENFDLIFLDENMPGMSGLETLSKIKAINPGIPVVIITGNPEGPLAQKSRLVLYTGGPEEVCPLGLTPTTSATAMAVIGDVLVVLLMERIAFTAQDYARRHHGGYLGQKSRNHFHEDS